MSWRLGLGGAVVAGLSTAAVVVAIMSATRPGGPDRIKTTIRWPTNCTSVIVDHPSHAPIMARWASFTVQTSDILCKTTGQRVAYAQFRNIATLNRAVAARQPPARYCRIGAQIVIDGLAGLDSTVFTDMCQSLGGTFINSVR